MLWEKSIVGLDGRPDSEGNPPDVVGDVRLADGVHVLARQDGGSHVADGVRGQGQHLVAADLQNVAAHGRNLYLNHLGGQGCVVLQPERVGVKDVIFRAGQLLRGDERRADNRARANLRAQVSEQVVVPVGFQRRNALRNHRHVRRHVHRADTEQCNQQQNDAHNGKTLHETSS